MSLNSQFRVSVNFRLNMNADHFKTKKRTCDRCKTRKIKCDSVNGKCVGCTSRGIKCTFERCIKKKGSKQGSGSSSSLSLSTKQISSSILTTEISPSPCLISRALPLDLVRDTIPVFNDLSRYSLNTLNSSPAGDVACIGNIQRLHHNPSLDQL